MENVEKFKKKKKELKVCRTLKGRIPALADLCEVATDELVELSERPSLVELVFVFLK